jgi:hypothetical protein
MPSAPTARLALTMATDSARQTTFLIDAKDREDANMTSSLSDEDVRDWTFVMDVAVRVPMLAFAECEWLIAENKEIFAPIRSRNS